MSVENGLQRLQIRMKQATLLKEVFMVGPENSGEEASLPLAKAIWASLRGVPEASAMSGEVEKNIGEERFDRLLKEYADPTLSERSAVG
jgi:hypothetical protein